MITEGASVDPADEMIEKQELELFGYQNTRVVAGAIGWCVYKLPDGTELLIGWSLPKWQLIWVWYPEVIVAIEKDGFDSFSHDEIYNKYIKGDKGSKSTATTEINEGSIKLSASHGTDVLEFSLQEL